MNAHPVLGRLGYSKKGYTSGEIGRAWLENFDKETCRKAKNRQRLLLVDGHNSHYTREFLEYACAHRIEVVGYPSHSTHIYQGLDASIFGPLKQQWGWTRGEWERKGHTVSKANFLAIYAEAQEKILTVNNIKTAFRVTGVIPFNPDVVTDEMMGPSLTTSVRANVPVQQSSPVKTVTEMVMDYIDYTASSSTQLDMEMNTPIPFCVRTAVDGLASTSAQFLTSDSLIQSQMDPPMYKPFPISPMKTARYADLLTTPARTGLENNLQHALAESEARDSARKYTMTGMQAGIVLSNVYTRTVQQQLQAVEEKNKKGKKWQLMGDGKAKFFSGDDFYAQCEEQERRLQEEEETAEKKRKQRETHALVLAAWEQERTLVRERNKVRKEKFDAAVAAWEVEKVLAKQEKRRPGWQKPKYRKDFLPENMPERPKRADGVEGGESDGEQQHDNGDQIADDE
jgi:hypothetical protein